MLVCFEISLQHINHESLWSFFVLTLHTALVLIWGNAWKSQAVFKNVHDWISLVDPHNQTNPFMSAYQQLLYTLPHEIFLQFLPFEWSEVILYNISAGEIVFITTVSRSKAFRRVPKIYGSIYDSTGDNCLPLTCLIVGAPFAERQSWQSCSLLV